MECRQNVLVGFEGGPGHQKQENRGSYGPTFSTQDGWDPAVAESGGTWDRLLLEGRNFRVALASSDYHNANMDYPPCAFSRTHVIAPERSVGGLLRALRAGTFWADQGRILDELDVRLETENLRGAARPGDTIFAPRNEILRVSLNSSIANACRRCPLLHEHEIALMVGTATAHSRVF